MFDKDSFVPAYIQVKNYFLEAIAKGEYLPNEKLPTEQQIADDWQISKTTVRQGLQHLIQSGVLYGKQGVGIFVNFRHMEVDTLSFAAFSSIAPQRIVSKVLSLEKMQAPAQIVSKIPQWDNTDLWYMERLRILDTSPAMYEISYVPYNMFPDITLEDMKFSKYSYIESHTREKIAYSERVFVPYSATERVANILQLPINSPVLKIESIGYLSTEDAFEYTELFHHPEYCMIKGRLPYKSPRK